MSLKGKFDTETWDKLIDLPLRVFCFIAFADGEVDDEEFEMLKEQLRDAPFYKSVLHRELLTDLVQSPNLQERYNRSMKRADFVRLMPWYKEKLQAKLNKDEYTHFVQSLFIEALKTSNVSGVGNAGQGKHISKEEDFALDTLIGGFDIPWPPPAAAS